MMKKILLLAVLISGLFSYELTYDKNTTGFIRHLKLYKYPKWVSMIELRNGKKLYFSSPKSMFELYFEPYKWRELNIRKEADFKALVVTDYNTLEPINAKGAFYVFGSRAISPAGDDLPAFKTYQEAEEFVKKYGGSRILSFDKISRALINLLDGRI